MSEPDISPEVPVLSLSEEQSRCLASAEGAVELRDHAGKTLGYLICRADVTRFYTPEEIAELRRLAADRTPGRTLGEIMQEVRTRVGA